MIKQWSSRIKHDQAESSRPAWFFYNFFIAWSLLEHCLITACIKIKQKSSKIKLAWSLLAQGGGWHTCAIQHVQAKSSRDQAAKKVFKQGVQAVCKQCSSKIKQRRKLAWTLLEHCLHTASTQWVTCLISVCTMFAQCLIKLEQRLHSHIKQTWLLGYWDSNMAGHMTLTTAIMYA